MLSGSLGKGPQGMMSHSMVVKSIFVRLLRAFDSIPPQRTSYFCLLVAVAGSKISTMPTISDYAPVVLKRRIQAQSATF